MLRYFLYIIAIGLTSSNIIFASNLDSLITSAKDNYTNGKYDEAIKNYESILGQGYESDQIYFNLGNAYFKIKNIPSSILYYEKASLLNPNDEDINFNLELAKTFSVDKIEPLPEFFFYALLNKIRSMFSSNGWAYLSVFFLIVMLVSVGFFLFTYQPLIKKISFAIGLLSIIIMFSSIVFSAQQKNLILKHYYGIVFQSVISVKSSPGESGKDLFILHAGTKVKITNSVGDWIEIKIADGSKGWVLSDTVQVI